jgi:hypothetical protein
VNLLEVALVAPPFAGALFFVVRTEMRLSRNRRLASERLRNAGVQRRLAEADARAFTRPLGNVDVQYGGERLPR